MLLLVLAAAVKVGSLTAAEPSPSQTVAESRCVSVVVAMRSSMCTDGELCKVEAEVGDWANPRRPYSSL